MGCGQRDKVVSSSAEWWHGYTSGTWDTNGNPVHYRTRSCLPTSTSHSVSLVCTRPIQSRHTSYFLHTSTAYVLLVPINSENLTATHKACRRRSPYPRSKVQPHADPGTWFARERLVSGANTCLVLGEAAHVRPGFCPRKGVSLNIYIVVSWRSHCLAPLAQTAASGSPCFATPSCIAAVVCSQGIVRRTADLETAETQHSLGKRRGNCNLLYLSSPLWKRYCNSLIFIEV